MKLRHTSIIVPWEQQLHALHFCHPCRVELLACEIVHFHFQCFLPLSLKKSLVSSSLKFKSLREGKKPWYWTKKRRRVKWGKMSPIARVCEEDTCCQKGRRRRRDFFLGRNVIWPRIHRITFRKTEANENFRCHSHNLWNLSIKSFYRTYTWLLANPSPADTICMLIGSYYLTPPLHSTYLGIKEREKGRGGNGSFPISSHGRSKKKEISEGMNFKRAHLMPSNEWGRGGFYSTSPPLSSSPFISADKNEMECLRNER